MGLDSYSEGGLVVGENSGDASYSEGDGSCSVGFGFLFYIRPK